MSKNYLRAVQPTYRVKTESGYSALDCSTAPEASDPQVTLGCYKTAGSIISQQYPITNAVPGTAAYKTACDNLGAEVTCLAKLGGVGSCTSLSETKRAEVCRNASNYVNIDHGLQTCTATKGSSTGVAWFDQYATDCCHRSGTNTACNPCANSTVMTPIDCGYSADSQKIPYICAPAVPPSDCGASNTIPTGQWFWNMDAGGCETSAAGKGWCECFKPYVNTSTKDIPNCGYTPGPTNTAKKCTVKTTSKKEVCSPYQRYPPCAPAYNFYNYSVGTCPAMTEGIEKNALGYLISVDDSGNCSYNCINSDQFTDKTDLDQLAGECSRIRQKLIPGSSITAATGTKVYTTGTGTPGDGSGVHSSSSMDSPFYVYTCPT